MSTPDSASALTSGSSSHSIAVYSPSDGSLLGSVPAMDASHIEQRIRATAAYQPTWQSTPWSERRHMLVAARAYLLEHADEAAQLVAREQGKPVTEALTAEVMTALDALHWCATQLPEHLQDLHLSHRMPFLGDKRSRVVATPAGLTTLLTAWNYPLTIPLSQAAMALAVGNTCLLRPSSATPLCGQLIARMFAHAGVPHDAFGLVTCRSSEAEVLVTHPLVRRVIFTGSNEVGQHLAALAAQGPKPIVLELGGKDPMVVFADANLERAARGAVWGAFMNAGQTCSSIERVYVQEEIREAFTAEVVRWTQRLRLGDPTLPETEVGPMTSLEGLSKVQAQVDEAVAAGARVLCGGQVRQERWFEPTVLDQVNHSMAVMQEETFGPLLPIMGFVDEAEAIRLANDSRFGLTASVWTRDRERATRVAQAIEAGVVTINDHNFTMAAGDTPWGGVKASGTGRTHGRFGVAELVDLKLISEDFSDRPKQLWWHPYDKASYQFMLASFPGLFATTLLPQLAGLSALVPHMGRLAREASLPSTLARIPDLLLD
jgi:acyl-CoA reductase-like NAD-dependent aldehyde dehydrogenase